MRKEGEGEGRTAGARVLALFTVCCLNQMQNLVCLTCDNGYPEPEPDPDPGQACPALPWSTPSAVQRFISWENLGHHPKETPRLTVRKQLTKKNTHTRRRRRRTRRKTIRAKNKNNTRTHTHTRTQDTHEGHKKLIKKICIEKKCRYTHTRTHAARLGRGGRGHCAYLSRQRKRQRKKNNVDPQRGTLRAWAPFFAGLQNLREKIKRKEKKRKRN